MRGCARRHGTVNAVLDHELLAYRRVFRKLGPQPALHWLAGLALAALYLLFVASLGWSVYRSAGSESEIYGWLLSLTGWSLFGLCLVAPGVMAPALVTERQRGSWDLLRLTRLSPRAIVLGKFIGRLMLPADLLLLAAAPVSICLAALPPEEVWRPLLGTLSTWGSALVGFSAVGLWCSSRARHAAGAIAMAYGLTAGLCLGVPLVEMMISEVVLDHGSEAPVLGTLCSPLVAWIALVADRSAKLTEPPCLAAMAQPLIYALATVGLLQAALRHMTSQTADEPRSILRRPSPEPRHG